jgi:hypothetical protein
MSGKEQQPTEEQQPKLRMSSEEAPEEEAESQQRSFQDEGDVGNRFVNPAHQISPPSRALPGVPAFPNARGGFLDRLQGMNHPGTPPYTPKGANPSPQHKAPKPQYDAA